MMQYEELLVRLRCDYPELSFRLGKRFKFRPPHTIYYEELPEQAYSELGDIEQENNCSTDMSAQPKNASNNCQSHTSSITTSMTLPEQNMYLLQLLHEVGHALLQHRSFRTDLERIHMEQAAWDKARELCGRYGVGFEEDFMETELETYRDWLHRRSACKICKQTCYQTRDGVYHCPFCETFGLNM